jgi:hypothetical protein
MCCRTSGWVIGEKDPAAIRTPIRSPSKVAEIHIATFFRLINGTYAIKSYSPFRVRLEHPGVIFGIPNTLKLWSDINTDTRILKIEQEQ